MFTLRLSRIRELDSFNIIDITDIPNLHDFGLKFLHSPTEFLQMVNPIKAVSYFLAGLTALRDFTAVGMWRAVLFVIAMVCVEVVLMIVDFDDCWSGGYRVKTVNLLPVLTLLLDVLNNYGGKILATLVVF